MTDHKRMDEIIELANKISTVAEGHTSAAVLYALINSLAIGIANTSHTEAELEKANEEVTAALRAASKGYWAVK
ncbi:MAG TPA: hypothetical protein VK451_03730 [Methyloceanibacter sp.]|jgi:hypothetical protein|nr:hypothetical protein [Methyloceanibacter sp.]